MFWLIILTLLFGWLWFLNYFKKFFNYFTNTFNNFTIIIKNFIYRNWEKIVKIIRFILSFFVLFKISIKIFNIYMQIKRYMIENFLTNDNITNVINATDTRNRIRLITKIILFVGVFLIGLGLSVVASKIYDFFSSLSIFRDDEISFPRVPTDTTQREGRRSFIELTQQISETILGIPYIKFNIFDDKTPEDNGLVDIIGDDERLITQNLVGETQTPNSIIEDSSTNNETNEISEGGLYQSVVDNIKGLFDK